MILKLAIEQARSQRRYTAWTAALLTFALTLTTFGLILFANQQVIQRDTAKSWTTDRDTMLMVSSGIGHDPADPTVTYEAFDGLPLDTVERAITDAITEGSDVVALRRGTLEVDQPSADEEWVPNLDVLAVTGAYDWDVVLIEGSSPGAGEIAVAAGWAENLGLGLGDTVSLRGALGWAGTNELLSPLVTYEISGLLKTCGDSFGYMPSCPGAFLAWEDSAAEGSPFLYSVNRPSDGVRIGWIAETTVAYSVDAPALRAFDRYLFGGKHGNFVTAFPPGAWLTLGIATLLVIGMITVAFAVGRAQAQARLQWVATARTLGATRRAVVTASLLETLLVAAASTAAALLFGILAAFAHRALHTAVVPHPFIPDTLSLPMWVFAGVAASGLVLAAIVAVVPAFWAARVPPVAALKPVNEVMEAEVSRRVKARWLVAPFLLGVAAVLVGGTGSGMAQTTLTAGYIVTGVMGFALGLEGLRLSIPVCGRWLSRRRPPWAIAAGDSLAARPRQGVAPALLQATTLTLGGLIATLIALNSFVVHTSSGPDGAEFLWREYLFGGSVQFTSGALATIIGLFAIIQVIALAIAFVGQRVTTTDAATRRALGLSSSGQRRAAFVQYAAPQAIGVLSGAIVGLVAAVFIHTSSPHIPESGAAIMPAEVLEATQHALGPLLWLMVVALGITTLGGLIVAASTGTRSPVEALRQVG